MNQWIRKHFYEEISEYTFGWILARGYKKRSNYNDCENFRFVSSMTLWFTAELSHLTVWPVRIISIRSKNSSLFFQRLVFEIWQDLYWSMLNLKLVIKTCWIKNSHVSHQHILGGTIYTAVGKLRTVDGENKGPWGFWFKNLPFLPV